VLQTEKETKTVRGCKGKVKDSDPARSRSNGIIGTKRSREKAGGKGRTNERKKERKEMKEARSKEE
jgi:hypothetical protein